MPETSPRRRRVAMVVATVLAVVVLAGCAGQKDPGSYGTGVHDDFISGCWTGHVADTHPGLSYLPTDNRTLREAKASKVATKAELSADQNTCQCIYGVLLKHVPFHEFAAANAGLRDKPGPLPSNIVNAYKDQCHFSAS